MFGPVKFRLIVFRPFKGEVILGKITSGTENGIKSASKILFTQKKRSSRLGTDILSFQDCYANDNAPSFSFNTFS